MENLSKQFITKLFCLSQSALPGKVKNKACFCLIDYLGVTFGGSGFYREKIEDYLSRNFISGESHIIGYASEVDLRTAAMINAFNAHILELDDSHRVALTHLGAPIFSALLAVAETHNCTILQLIRGAVTGYEAAIRIGSAVQTSHKQRGFHSSGTCCTIGCAMGIAAMLGFSEDEMSNVLSASTTSAAGLLEVIGGVSQQKPYNLANATVAGIDAALFGRYFSGADDILNGKNGFFRALSDEYHVENLFEGGYAIDSIYQKCYASCRHCHAPMEAILKIKERSDKDWSEIDRIDVNIYDLAIFRHDHTEITGVSSAKQSIPYSVAAAYYYGEGSAFVFSEKAISDPNVLELTRKVKLIDDPELSRLVPKKRAAVATVYYKNGESESSRIDYAKGEPENPFSREEIIDKFSYLMFAAGYDLEYQNYLLNLILDRRKSHVKALFEVNYRVQ